MLSKRASENYISPNMLAESVVWELCTSGALEKNIEAVNKALAERRDALVTALEEKIPEAEFVVPGGGYFLWLALNDDVDTTELLVKGKDEGVAFVAGPDFMIDGGSNELRLSFASVPADQVAEGVERIARALSWRSAALRSRIAVTAPGESPVTCRTCRWRGRAARGEAGGEPARDRRGPRPFRRRCARRCGRRRPKTRRPRSRQSS